MPTIFILDDDAEILSALKLFMSQNGYVVGTFTNSNDLLKAISLLVPDMILLDVRLSEEEDGKLICQEIKQILDYPNKIYLYSATHIEQEDVLKCCADGFIEKPFDIFSLMNTINQVVAK